MKVVRLYRLIIPFTYTNSTEFLFVIYRFIIQLILNLPTKIASVGENEQSDFIYSKVI